MLSQRWGAEPAWPGSARPGREIPCLRMETTQRRMETEEPHSSLASSRHTLTQTWPRENGGICERETERAQVRILTLLASPVASDACFSLRTLGSCCIQSRQPAFILGCLARLDEMVHLRKVLEAASVVIAPGNKIQCQPRMGKEKSLGPATCLRPHFLSIETGHLLCARMVGGAGSLPWPPHCLPWVDLNPICGSFLRRHSTKL